jgi:hypothetical protein
MTVLLIGNAKDPHVHKIEAVLDRRSVQNLVLDPRSPGSMATVNLGRDRASPSSFRHGGSSSAESGIRSVWLRFKPERLTERENGELANAIRFVDAEWNAFLRGLAYRLSHASWINPIRAEGTSKLQQLQVAREEGLEIPETAVTNDPDQVLELIARRGRCIYKSLTPTDFSDRSWIWTSAVTAADVEAHRDNIARAPGIFQEQVPKIHELRVTIVGDRIFPVRIITPQDGTGDLDWRLSERRNRVERCGLEPKIAEALLRYHRRMNLVYAAYDLIVRPDGQNVFLECNRGGQYVWLEDALDLGISEAVADALIEGRAS